MNIFLIISALIVHNLIARLYITRGVKAHISSQEELPKQIIESIKDVFERSPDPSEKKLFNNIESIRARLESSNEILEIMDFGARATSPEGTQVKRILGEITLSASKPKQWASLLFYIVKRIRPERCLEFGTCVGLSTLYQSAALEMNGRGSIVTMEGSDTLAAIAKKNFTDLQRSNIVPYVGRFDSILTDVLTNHQPFDLVFIDGHHEEKATVRYFEHLLPCVTRNAVLIFDDIHWSAGMKNAWKSIVHHRRVKYSVDLYELGIIIVS